MNRAERNAITRVLYKRSLYHLCKYGCSMTDISWNTHGGMIRNLEAPTKRKLIVMPRGTLKSSIGVVGYSIWRLIRDPNDTILIDSEVYENSKNFLREIKALLQTDRMTELFGNFHSSPWSEGELTIAQRNKPIKEASITCGGVNTIKVGAHFNCIIHDDVNSNNNSQTQESRKKVLDHFRLNLAILNPGGTSVVVGTRYSSDDVIGNVLKDLGLQ